MIFYHNSDIFVTKSESAKLYANFNNGMIRGFTNFPKCDQTLE